MMQIQQHEKTARAEMERLKLSASLSLVKILEKMPEVSNVSTASIFMPFPNRDNEAPITENLSAYNAIHRYQPHISTIEVSQQELEIIQEQKKKKLNYPFKSYDDFRNYGFDPKYLLINGKVHKKPDSREQNFISALTLFMDKNKNNLDFKSQHPQIFFALDIIPNLNSILTLHLLKIPELAGKGELTHENFGLLLSTYNEATRVYQNLIDAINKTNLISSDEKQLLRTSLETEKENLQKYFVNTFPAKMIKTVIVEQIKPIQTNQAKLNGVMQTLSDSKDKYDHTKTVEALDAISQLGIESEKLLPYLSALSKFASKDDKDSKKICTATIQQLKSFQDEAQVHRETLMRNSIIAINKLDSPKKEETLFKLLISCIRMQNEPAINYILNNNDSNNILQSIMKQKEKPNYINPLDEERLSKISHLPLGKELHDNLFPKNIHAASPQVSSSASILGRLSPVNSGGSTANVAAPLVQQSVTAPPTPVSPLSPPSSQSSPPTISAAKQIASQESQKQTAPLTPGPTPKI